MSCFWHQYNNTTEDCAAPAASAVYTMGLIRDGVMVYSSDELTADEIALFPVWSSSFAVERWINESGGYGADGMGYIIVLSVRENDAATSFVEVVTSTYPVTLLDNQLVVPGYDKNLVAFALGDCSGVEFSVREILDGREKEQSIRISYSCYCG